MRIIVIDSGLDDCYSREHIVGGVSIIEKDGKFIVSEGFSDTNGHGTNVTDTILSYTDKAEIYVVKLYENEEYTSPEKLIYALNYVCNEIEADLIQISSGVIRYTEELHNVIKKITEKKIIVISAFSNDKTISYPAALPEVIGVDINEMYNKKEMFDIVFGDIIDIRAGNEYLRMKGLNGKKKISKGTSFLTSYFTATIANKNLSGCNKEQILQSLKSQAINVLIAKKHEEYTASSFVNQMKKAIVFPFNKEVNAIAANEDLLPFKIDSYYDVKHKFLVGRQVKDVLGYSDNEKVINSYANIDWTSDFDTIICGHIREIEQFTKTDYISDILKKCRKYKKKAYFFDDLSLFGRKYKPDENIYYTTLQDNPNLLYRFGKLNTPHTPILTVLGTSSKQGKYSIQLDLLREFRKRGASVGSIATEPTGPLLSFDDYFSFGYGSRNDIPARSMIRILNEKIRLLEKNNPDIIISGCQSATTACDFRTERTLPLEQYAYLLGMNPDGAVLCVNSFDAIEYIKRTIEFIESYGNARVIAIVISEAQNNNNKTLQQFAKEYDLHKKQLEEETNKPIFRLFDLDIVGLVDKIVEYYS